MIRVLWLPNDIFGGCATYTVQLARALRSVGFEVEVNRVRHRTEGTVRHFYDGEMYRNIALYDLLGTEDYLIITNLDNDSELACDIAKNCPNVTLIVHDHLSLAHGKGDIYLFLPPKQTVVIRRHGLSIIPEATLILHPYQRIHPVAARVQHAISRTRIADVKNIPIILDANRQLPMEKRIKIHGIGFRPYVYHILRPKYPELPLNTSFPTTAGASSNLAATSLYDVDLTQFRDRDGGETQYTMLEAWDARTVPILHRSWLSTNYLKEGRNCLAIDTVDELVAILSQEPNNLVLDSICDANEKLLANHTPERIGASWKEYLCTS